MAAPTLAHEADDRRLTRACLAVALALIAAVAWVELRALPRDGLPMYDEAAHLIEALPFRDRLAARDVAGLAGLIAQADTKGVVYNLLHGAALLMGGASIAVLRATGVLCLLGGLALLYPLGRLASGPRRDPRVGALAVFFAASCPLLLQWGRSAMVEPLNLALNALALIAVLQDRERRTLLSATLAALALLLAFFAKFNQGVILLGAVAISAALDCLSAPHPAPHSASQPGLPRTAASRLRALLPLVLAAAALLAWLPFGTHWEGLRHYLTAVKGGGEPVRFDAAFYPRTLAERFAPWAGATLALAVAFVAGLRAALRPGARLLLVHATLGIVLASFNASKRTRLLVPLAPGLLVTAALGVPLIVDRLRAWAASVGSARLPRRLPALIAGMLAVAYVAPGWPSLADIRVGAPAGLEAVVDAGLELAGGRRPTLWVGSCAVGGEPRLSANHVIVRALEHDRPDALLPLPYLSELTGAALTRNDVPMSEALRGFVQVIAISDAGPRTPGFSEPIARQAVEALRAGGAFQQTALRTITLPVEPGAPPRSVSVTLWTRIAGP